MALIIMKSIYGKINTKLPFQGEYHNLQYIPRLRPRAELRWAFSPKKAEIKLTFESNLDLSKMKNKVNCFCVNSNELLFFSPQSGNLKNAIQLWHD